MVTTRRGAGGKQRALVTGGSGFLGRHLVRQLLATGRYDVTVFDIRQGEDEEQEGLAYVVGDLRKPEDVASAVAGADVVFHVATAAPTAASAHNRALMHSVNVEGTRNVVEAAAAAGVQRLVYTSSASVVFEGKDLKFVDESTPYAARPLDYYTQTKIDGEKIVLAANGSHGLRVCALRPSGIFGEYDQLTVPTAIAKAKEGKLKFYIGNGKNLMDWTYAGNVAQAHIEAAEALIAPDSPAAGQAYFITNDEPRPFWGFMGDICEGLGYGRPRIWLPFWPIYFIALIMQYLVVPLLHAFGKNLQSEFTPFRITVTASWRTFSCHKARQDLGYKPSVSMDEAIRRTLKHFSHLHSDKQPQVAGKKA